MTLRCRIFGHLSPLRSSRGGVMVWVCPRCLEETGTTAIAVSQSVQATLAQQAQQHATKRRLSARWLQGRRRQS